MERLIGNAYKILLHITIISSITLILNTYLNISGKEIIGWISLSLVVYSLIFVFLARFLKNILKQKKSSRTNLGDITESPESTNKNEMPAVDVDIYIDELEELKKIVDRKDLLLSKVASRFEAVQALYLENKNDFLYIKATYAYKYEEEEVDGIHIQDGFFGAVKNSKRVLVLDNVPEGLLKPFSGLGSSKPVCLILIPVLEQDQIIGFFELATFKNPDNRQLKLAEYLASNLGGIMHSNGIREIKELA